MVYTHTLCGEELDLSELSKNMLFPLLLSNSFLISSNISSVDFPRIRSLNFDLLRSRRSAKGIIYEQHRLTRQYNSCATKMNNSAALVEGTLKT